MRSLEAWQPPLPQFPGQLSGLTMKTLGDLRHCADAPALRKAVLGICADFGTVKRLEILTAEQDGVPQAICFLSLDNPDHELALMRALGLGRFGGEIVFVVNLARALYGEGAVPEWAWAIPPVDAGVNRKRGQTVEQAHDPPDP